MEQMSDTAARAATKIGLVAHYSSSNYGNHLVNYAARRILERCGCEVDLLVPEGGRLTLTLGRITRLPLKLLRLGPVGLWDRVRGRLQRRVASAEAPAGDSRSHELRLARFRQFSDEHLRPIAVDVSRRVDLVRSYDAFAVGSDQIWNYDYDLGPWHFLDFVHGQPTVTLSPSVGHDVIPREWMRSYKSGLSRFREVGVRELRWVESLPSWPGRPEFTLLLDPTLMVTREEWAEIASLSPSDKPYILVYALGDLLPEQRSFIAELSEIHGLEVRWLSERVGGELWETNAADFLGMVSGAACVVTDSYHGAIFSFLFDRPLALIRRHGFAGAMNARVETLVKLCHLDSRFIDLLDPAQALAHDYREGHRALEDHRVAYWDYLDRHGLAPSTHIHVTDRGE